MQVIRHLLTQRHLAVLICAATLLLKLLVPTGYMIANDHGRFAITICSGIAPAAMTMGMPEMHSNADETTVRSRLDWSIGSGWTFALDLTGYTAKREFLLADSQTFVAPTTAFPNGSFRQTYQDFRHDHRFWNARGVAGNDSVIAGLRNRFSLGVEHNDTDFVSLRQTAPMSALPALDVRNPAFIPLTGAAYRTAAMAFRSAGPRP